MNYLAHGYLHLRGDPWFLAGTALPDWLRVLDRGARVRPETIAPHAASADPRVAALARGALRHHEDDRRFHGSAAFTAARREVTDLLRAALPTDAGHRPSFLAHIVVEVELDASLVEESPRRVDDYYSALASIDADALEATARVVAPTSSEGLARLVRRFIEERFVADYADPAAAVRRLDRVVRGVGQPALPAGLAAALPAARAVVEARRSGLLEAARDADARSAG